MLLQNHFLTKRIGELAFWTYLNEIHNERESCEVGYHSYFHKSISGKQPKESSFTQIEKKILLHAQESDIVG